MNDTDSKKLVEARKEYDDGRCLNAGGNYVKVLESHIEEQEQEIKRLKRISQETNRLWRDDKAELSSCKERVRELEETLFKIKRDSLEPDKIYIHLSRALGPALEAQEQREE